MIQDNLFNYKHFVFLKLAVALALISGIAYLIHTPAITANGGTWLGYTLGTVGALLIVWLMWLGVRKRQYSNETGNLRAWVSAHIYLGLALTVVATLHTGFQIGWNVHSLAYVLMMATIASGGWGLTLYVQGPKAMSDVLNRQSPEELASLVEQLDREAAKASKQADQAVQTLVAASAGQGVFNQRTDAWRGHVSACLTDNCVNQLQQALQANPELADLYRNQVQRLRALKQLRRYYHLRFWMDLWLSVHVPLSFGLLAALLAHVLSVFIYW
ncbi:hypothetical protein NQT62_07480 [Limnobacter humi]|uniref:Ferric reductase like transmembrane component n=1 Tax=Limnobacter humi TaxID=1778671 RepID=A0ABT1WFH6_9BURK|nr:hypothetical protein [Limnobacter humi]MCQ8896275.1 hypothetical protein [Limnobacter humi]